MLHALRENARTLRALAAVCAACALSVLFFSKEIHLLKEKERLVFHANALIWRMSETIFHVQGLSADLTYYSQGRIEKYNVNTRFDILWGRLDMVYDTAVGRTEKLGPAIVALQEYLQQEEDVIYHSERISHKDILRIQPDLERLAISARQAWNMTFANEARQAEFVDLLRPKTNTKNLYHLGVVLIFLLLAYVLSEVFLANREQKRMQRLHKVAKDANEAKSRFLANVSHEIRTPLNGILGMASELSESELSRDQRECISVIEQSGELLLGTINDVLDLSKVEAGRLELEGAVFDMHRVLKSARDLHASRAREKGLHLSLSINDFVPQWVLGDERRLQQVMHNLVANAIKFTGKGSVTIDAMLDTDSGDVVLQVADTGVGIPADALKKIFDPFVQADASVTRKYGGTGLGLTISHQITNAMGGQLSVESEPERGSCFEVRLPLTRVDEAQESKAKEDENNEKALEGKRVLIADDNATNRLILDRYLAPEKCIISTASCGEEAVKLALEAEFDVILMDIQMPGVGGVEATKRIRHAEGEAGRARVPIFAVTANVMSHQVSEYIASGMDRVLPKPLSKKRLLEELLTLGHPPDTS
ncbi:MAG: ATP-binding protein [Pelagimonas sp.]|uniref:ATP-binding protein n=1 Tax=Pelagimonas sp. TaxID=2073170 RepID=UPI003D6B72FF